MKVTRDVIQDLLPLYLGGEASPDTVALVEHYLETDPELAEMAQQVTMVGLAQVPVPLTKEAEMEAYKKAQKWIAIRTIGLALIIAAVVLSILLIVPLVIMFLR